MQADTITNIYTAQVLLTMGDTITFLCHKSTLANVTEQPGLWFSFCTVLVVGKQQMRIIDDSVFLTDFLRISIAMGARSPFQE